MAFYAIAAILVLGTSAALTFIGGRSRRRMIQTAAACVSVLALADVLDPRRSEPVSPTWMFMAVLLPVTTGLVISVLAGAKVNRWVQWIVGVLAGLMAIVASGVLSNSLKVQ